MFDPGQGLPLFSGPELVEMIDAASFVAVNDYEARLYLGRILLDAGEYASALVNLQRASQSPNLEVRMAALSALRTARTSK